MLKKTFRKSVLFSLITLATTLLYTNNLQAAQKNSYSYKPYKYRSNNYNIKKYHTPYSYSKKAPYSGYGKQSKVNGLYKNKITSGYIKKTNKGYTYVYPYARSK